MKRILSLFLSVVMLSSIMVGIDFSSFAADAGETSAPETAAVQTADDETAANTADNEAAAQTADDETAATADDEATATADDETAAQAENTAGGKTAAQETETTESDTAGGYSPAVLDAGDATELATGTSGNVTYTIYDDGRLVLTGTGTMNTYSASGLAPWNSDDYTITDVIIGYGITNVGAYAFYNMTSIESVAVETKNSSGADLEDGDVEYTTVTAYATYCFANCSSIQTFKLPSSATFATAYCFKDCTAVTDVTLVRTTATYYVAKGGTTAFSTSTAVYTPWYISSNAGNTVNITLEKGITAIANYSFYKCNIGIYTAGCNVTYNTNSFNSVVAIQKVVLTAGDDSTTVKNGSTSFSATTCKYTPWYLGSLTEVTLSDDITGIGDYAFANSTALKTINLENITSFGTYAFNGCSVLNNITLNSSITSIPTYLFGNCTALESIDLSNVTEIGAGAFIKCSSLKDVDLSNVTTLGGSAFNSCTSLEKVDLSSLTSITGASAFNGCSNLFEVVWTEYINTISYGLTFQDCTSLTTFDVKNLTAIDTYTFNGCTSLETVYNFQNVTNVGTCAFQNCTALKTIDLSNVTTFDTYAFYGCKSLESADLSSCQTLSNYLFTNCTGLKELTVLSDADFYSSTYADRNPFYGCTGIEKITIKAGESGTLKRSGTINYTATTAAYTPWAYGCDSGIDVIIENGVTAISEYAFYGSNIKSINVPDGVTGIEQYTFYNSANLVDITLPDTLTSIGIYAFVGTGCYDDVNYYNENGVLSINNYVIGVYPKDDSGVAVIDPATKILAPQAFLTHGAGVKDLTIPVSFVNAADATIFTGLTSLEKVTLTADSNGTDIADYDETTLKYSPWYNSAATLAALVVEDGVTQIGSYAFYNMTALVDVTLGKDIIRIGSYAFQNTAYVKDSSNYENGVLYNGTYVVAADESLMPADYYAVKDGTTLLAAYAFYNFASPAALEVPTSVIYINEYALYGCNVIAITIPAGTTEIEPYAFYNCSSLTTINIPDTVVSIGEYAFYGCASLTGVELPAGVTEIKEYTFYGCESLTGIDISAITSIGEYAFGGSGLTSVELPAVITEIADGVFYNCAGLSNVALSDSTTSIGAYAFYNNTSLAQIDLPETLITIGKYAFAGAGLTSVDLPAGVTAVADGVFQRCKSLTGITIGENVTTLGNDVFASSALESITITANLETIGTGVFKSCSSLTSVTFEDGVQLTEIPANTFNGCTQLAAVEIPASVETIGSQAFKNCTSLATVDLGSVAEIGSYAFNYCTALTDVTIPETCEKVSDYAFAYCTALSNVTLSEGVAEIGSNAFAYDKSITAITIPSTLAVLGQGAFEKCTALAAVEFAAAEDGSISLTEIGDWAFAYDTALTAITVPEGIVVIGSYAFYNDSALSQASLPETLETIGYYAFAGTAITELDLGAAVSNIGSYAFSDCDSLSVITVDENNTVYTAEGNILFTADMSEIVLYPNGITAIYYEVPDSVTAIAEGAFENDSLQSVVIPAGVQTVESDAFANCASITDVVIESFFTEIGSSATTFGSAGEVTVHGESYSTAYDYAKSYSNVNFDSTDYYTCTDSDHLYLKSAVADVNTCTTETEITYICALCGATKTENTAAAGHSWDNGEITTAPTCTAKGVKTYTCTACGATKTEEVAATGHNYNAVVTAPTCTAKGYTTHTCTVCGDTYTDSETAITAHSYNAVVTDPTCTAKGYTTYTCKDCGASYQGNTTAATGHNYQFTKYKVKATTSQKGTKLYTCSDCKATKEVSYAKVADMSLSTTVYTYDGDPKTPTITVKDANGNTISSKWYCVQYYSYKTADSVSKMQTVGKYYVKITFRTKYAGSLKADVTIKPKATSISSLTAGANSFTVKVKKVTSCTTGYQVQYSTSKSFTNATTKTITDNTVTSKKISGLTAGKTYYVRVRTYKTLKVNGENVKFYSEWSTGKAVTPKPKATSISSVTALSKGFTVKWNKVTTQTSGYQIQYSTDKSFSSYTTKTVSSNKTTSKKITGLKANKKYYVRVRTYKTVTKNGKSTKVYSSWSKAKSVTTKK